MDHLDIERRRDELTARFRHLLRPYGGISVVLGAENWSFVVDTATPVDPDYPGALIRHGKGPAEAFDAIERALIDYSNHHPTLDQMAATLGIPAGNTDRIPGGAAGADPANPEDVL